MTGESHGGRRLLSASELAEALGVSLRWIYLKVEEHSLPAYRLGRSLRFDPDAVYAWLETKRIGAWESCAEAGDVVRFS